MDLCVGSGIISLKLKLSRCDYFQVLSVAGILWTDNNNLLMILVQNFMLINNHIETWVGKLISSA